MGVPSSATPLRERARMAIVDLIPKGLGQIYSQTRTALSLGWKDSGRLHEATNSRPGDLLKFEIPGFPYPVFVRSGSTDAETFEECLIRQYYGHIKPNRPVKFIIDAGANAGYSGVFFLRQYPEATVVALEPDSENYALALRNLEPYGERCRVLSQAIWPTKTRLLIERSNRHDSTRVSESDVDGEFCTSVDPMTILEMFHQERIDIFKCDIEGAEEHLFSDNSDAWLERTDNVMMEIHGGTAHKIVYDAIRRHGFAAEFNHDLHFFTRRDSSGRKLEV